MAANAEKNVRTTRLASGLTIVTDRMPDVRSATLGFWFRVGSRDEPRELNGICHFIEHAVFKGSAKRSAIEIAAESDRLGGNLNAFTSHEETAFVIKVVDEKVSAAFDLLADMLTAPRFEERELARERKVIIEEMRMIEDSPEELLGELFLRRYYPRQPLGLPIEGSARNVRTFRHDVVDSFFRRNFTPANLVISCAGNVRHEEIASLARKAFDGKRKRQPARQLDPPRPSPNILVKHKENLEQAHLILAFPWIPLGDDRRYAASLLVSILGDGNASRLWQSIRENRGLAYSVGAGADSFIDSGVFSVFAGTSPDSLGDVIDLAVEEIRALRRDGVTEDELDLAKEQAAASVLLSLESSSARAEVLAHNQFVHGKQIPPSRTLRRIWAVTREEIGDLAREFLTSDTVALAALGKLDNFRVRRRRLNVDS